jgi:DNA segregation ATPase FtsK/SpoIIIE-like protein
MVPEKQQDQRQWSRQDIAEKMAEYEKEYLRTPSQRQLAEQLGIPRSTLQHWLARKENIDADPELVAFFESPVGLAFLHRLVLAAHFVMTLVGPSGIRLVCLFLELTGLNQFVAASYRPHWQVSAAMEQAIGDFDQAEKERLGETMEPKQITVCEDETFHPETCLVAIEPVSNFILLEQYTQDRKADTWTNSLAEATKGLPIEVIQSTSDEGRGILHHVKQDLGVHHSPDLFHVQNELVKGTSGALASKVRQAVKAVEKAPTQAAQQALEIASQQQARAQQLIRQISEIYHPYDLQTGTVRSAEALSSSLQQHFAELEAVAQEAGLSEHCFDRIKKAKRVVVQMVATLAFFLLTLRAKVEALALAPEVEQAIYDHLIPAIYLHLVSEKTQEVSQRQHLQTKSKQLLAPLLPRDGPFGQLDQKEKVVIEQVAQECAGLFQRSSSCVEGRNGQLALRHHSLHRLSDRKLKALTGVHNYFVKRADGTTAAERFFGSKPRDLFEWLLDRVDIPSRPAQKRSQPRPKTFLVPAAT